MRQHEVNNAIGIRVADARRQGIHPLAALGIPMGSSTPIATGDYSQMGQDLSRAALQGMTQPQRDSYVQKEAAQFDARARSNAVAMQDLDLEMKRLQLERLQRQVTAEAAGFDVTPAQVTASNPSLPGVAAGPAGPGFKATSIGFGQRDIGDSALSEWAEGAGLVGHAMVPFWMYEQAIARGLKERSEDQALAERSGDRAYAAALEELHRRGRDRYYMRRRSAPPHGWEIVERPGFTGWRRQSGEVR